MMKSRLLALLFAVFILVGGLSGCAGNNNNDKKDGDTDSDGSTGAVSTSDENVVYVDINGYEIDELPQSLNYGDKKITALVWSDHTMREFESSSDTQTADIVDDAILLRNKTVEERLGIELAFVQKVGNGDHMTEFIKEVETGEIDGAYDYIASYSRVAPTLALSGRTCNLYELEHMNGLSKPWWPDSLIREATLGGKLFFCTGDISTNMLWMMQATFFNKSLISRYELDDPYELVKNGDWTIQKFFEMCEGKYEEIDNASGKSAGDRFGLTLYSLNLDDYQISANIKPVENIDGKLQLSGDFTEDKISDLVTDFIGFIRSDDVYYENSVRNPRDVFFSERAVFMTDRVFVIAGKDNSSDTRKIEFEYGIVPNPKYDKAQKRYITNIGHPYTMYSVPVGISTERQQTSGAVLECLASESYRKVTPQVFELAMKVKYSYGEDSAYMFDLIRETLNFDIGRLFDIGSGNYTSAAFRQEILSGTNSWHSNYRKAEAAVQKSIDDINAAFDE